MKVVPLRRTTRFTILCRRRHDSMLVGALAVIMRTKTIEVGMTQTDNRVPQRPTAVTERAATPGRGAGRGGPTIIPFPVYRGDVCGSLLGAMLFPCDRANADTYSARLSAGRPQAFTNAGNYVFGRARPRGFQ
jgi:hypothetical protein